MRRRSLVRRPVEAPRRSQVPVLCVEAPWQYSSCCDTMINTCRRFLPPSILQEATVRVLRSRPKDHITCFCSVVPKPFISSGNEDTRSHSYFTNKKTLSATRRHIVTANKTTPSGAQRLSRKEADQTDHGGIITFRCLRKHDVITTPYSTFSWSCLGINCTAVIGSSSSTTSSVSGKCGRWQCLRKGQSVSWTCRLHSATELAFAGRKEVAFQQEAA